LAGDKVQGTGYTIFKVRIRSSDVARGKSGGYRVIYYPKRATAVFLVTTYFRTEQSDIPPAKIRKTPAESSEYTFVCLAGLAVQKIMPSPVPH